MEAMFEPIPDSEGQDGDGDDVGTDEGDAAGDEVSWVRTRVYENARAYNA